MSPDPGRAPLQSGLLAAQVDEAGPGAGAKSVGSPAGSPTSSEERCGCIPAPPALAASAGGDRGRPPAIFLVEFLGECSWILSEATWILLLPVPCLATGLLALALLGAPALCACVRAGCRAPERWLPQALQAYWLLTNFAWMLEELLWDTPDRQTPWRLTPMLGPEDQLYEKVQWYCVLSFLVAPAVWILMVCALAVRGWSAGRGADPGRWWRPACGLFCQAGFIASWALMDGMWSAELLWPSVACCVLTVGLIVANAAWETGLGVRGADRTDAVWVLWTLANLVWIVDELGADDVLSARYAAAGLALAALALQLCSWRQALARHRLRSQRLAETGADERSCPEPLAEAPAGLAA